MRPGAENPLVIRVARRVVWGCWGGILQAEALRGVGQCDQGFVEGGGIGVEPAEYQNRWGFRSDRLFTLSRHHRKKLGFSREQVIIRSDGGQRFSIISLFLSFSFSSLVLFTKGQNG